LNCNLICIKYKARKPFVGGRYADGQKRCQGCEIYIKFPGVYCPCCGHRLRTKPRDRGFKAKLREQVRRQTLED